ncbi:MAG: dockerin type I repeat-containing protein [Muribaculaceae bacterium]|nr:dockerin type I repeat-containing protein [Muribaculaceae bacterium]
MKKLITLLFLLMTVVSSRADNYFTFQNAVNDTLLIHPRDVGRYSRIYVNAHFEGYLDHWYLAMSHPQNIPIIGITALSGIDIPYVDRFGNDSICHPTVQTSETDLVDSITVNMLSSTVTQHGYWDPDNDGYYDTYGTVKWGPGDHESMFRFDIEIPAGCTEASLLLTGELTSTDDWRGVATVGSATFNKVMHLVVGYQRGDVDGSESLTISDVTMLMNYIMSQSGFDQFQLAAADVNRDGIVNISDVTALIYILNQKNGTNGLSLDDFDI